MEEQKIACANCKSREVVKRGNFQTEAHGKQQRYFCKSCGKKFIPQNAFYRMRNTPQKITLCIDLFYRGVSTRKVQEHLQVFYPHNSSHMSIYRWVVRYAKQISNFVGKLKIIASPEVQVDEVQYHRRKSHKKGKKGVEENWFIDSIDTQTKFMVASNYYKSRGQKEIKQVMRAIKDKTESQVKTLTTDGLTPYENVVKSVWGYNNKIGKFNVIHNKITASKGEGFNYPIERLHNSVRARTKLFRGFHGSIESANAIMKGLEIYYNFITRHQTIDCSPYELAIPELKEKLGINKWLGLINLSSQQSI